MTKHGFLLVARIDDALFNVLIFSAQTKQNAISNLNPAVKSSRRNYIVLCYIRSEKNEEISAYQQRCVLQLNLSTLNVCMRALKRRIGWVNKEKN